MITVCPKCENSIIISAKAKITPKSRIGKITGVVFFYKCSNCGAELGVFEKGEAITKNIVWRIIDKLFEKNSQSFISKENNLEKLPKKLMEKPDYIG